MANENIQSTALAEGIAFMEKCIDTMLSEQRKAAHNAIDMDDWSKTEEIIAKTKKNIVGIESLKSKFAEFKAEAVKLELVSDETIGAAKSDSAKAEIAKSEPDNSEAKPAEQPKPAAKPAEQPKPAAKPVEQPKPAVKPAEQPQPAAKPAEQPQPAAKPAEQPKPAPKPVEPSKPTMTAKPAEQPKPTADAKPAAKPTEQPQPAAKPAEQPKPAPKPVEQSKPTMTAKPAEQPKPTADAKPAPKPAERPQNSPRSEANSNILDMELSDFEPAPKPKNPIITACEELITKFPFSMRLIYSNPKIGKFFTSDDVIAENDMSKPHQLTNGLWVETDIPEERVQAFIRGVLRYCEESVNM